MISKTMNIERTEFPFTINYNKNKDVSRIDEVEKYAKLLFEKVEPVRKARLKNNCFKLKIENSDNVFSGNTLYNIARTIKKIVMVHKFNEFIFELDLTSINSFADKNTYIFLDLIIFHLVYNCHKCNLKIYYDFQNDNTVSNGFANTILYRTCKDSPKVDRESFLNEYVKSMYLYCDCYRRLLLPEDFENQEIISRIYGDIFSFLNNSSMIHGLSDVDWFEDISETLSETLCNAKIHNKGLYLIDIDCCLLEGKLNKKNHLAVNISVINLGYNLIYSKMKQNVENKFYDCDDAVFSKVYEAYNNHKFLFDKKYNEKMFFIITTFQNRVTTKHKTSGSNGTGLTNLIKSIINRTEEEFSYVLSGKEILRFNNNILKLSEDGFIGFNYENDYINASPEKEFLAECKLFIPGTVFQLHLVRRNDDEQN